MKITFEPEVSFRKLDFSDNTELGYFVFAK